MICPKCGTDNLGGKLLCYKCGAKLLKPSGVAPKAGKRRGKAKGTRALVHLFILGLLAGVIFLMLQKPEMEPLETSTEAARRFEAKMAKVERAASARKSVKLEVTEEEINSQVAEQVKELMLNEEYAKQNIRVDGMQVRLKGDKLKTIVTLKVRGKSVYISLWGNFILIDGKLGLTPDRVAVGRMPMLPALLKGLIGQVEKGEVLPLPTLPSGVRSIRVEGGKLIIEAGPEAEVVKEEVKPPAEKIEMPEKEISATEAKEVPVPEAEAKPLPEKKALTGEKAGKWGQLLASGGKQFCQCGDVRFSHRVLSESDK